MSKVYPAIVSCQEDWFEADDFGELTMMAHTPGCDVSKFGPTAEEPLGPNTFRRMYRLCTCGGISIQVRPHPKSRWKKLFRK